MITINLFVFNDRDKQNGLKDAKKAIQIKQSNPTYLLIIYRFQSCYKFLKTAQNTKNF